MTIAAPPLTVAELEGMLRAANPGAVLLPPRRLRRVIKEDRNLGGLGLQVPHRHSYTIGRDRLLGFVPRDELGVPPEPHLPATLLLLPRPDSDDLARKPRGALLRRYWRLLFHARIHAVLERQLAEGRLTPAIVAERIRCIGSAAFSEIRLVLEQERLLLPSPSPYPLPHSRGRGQAERDESTIYVEFAALFLELRIFAPRLLRAYFPTIEGFEEIDALLGQDVDSAGLLAETRLDGALDPADPGDKGGDVEGGPAPVRSPEAVGCVERTVRVAERAERRGNVVRAARMYYRAGREEAAQAELDRLVERLQVALELEDDEKSRWRAALKPLLAPAAGSLWPVEARLLYDLQKVCIDRERAIYAVDVVEWVYSLGKRPIKRLLPGQTEVMQVKHLRSAARRAAATRIPAAQRHRLEELLHAAVERAEHAVRELFRPRLAEVLDDVGMRPANVPEQVALNKLTEEMLDRVVERGYLNTGNLRDAVSRNNLRLPDLSGPREFIRGDRLIRANRRLPALLDGVYRRGEFYLRWLQRLSAVAFGTAVGRFLVLYLLLPFGGAFVTVEGVRHVVLVAAKYFAVLGVTAGPTNESEAPVHAEAHAHHFHASSVIATVLLGSFLFGLMHSVIFRGWVLRALFVIGQGLHVVLLDLPAIVLKQPAVRWLLDSGPVVWFGRYLARPVLAGLLVWLVCLPWLPQREAFVAGVAAFLVGCFFFSSRLARELEEAVTDWLARLWQRLSIELIPALFHFVVAVFKSIVEVIDRMLYTVDEWLRFRAGQSQATYVWKLIASTLWFVVSYVVRLYVNLFIEPTTNPIKHFPVVTVAHKIMAPFIPVLFGAMKTFFEQYMNHALADALAGIHVFLFPGIFGFLAWELKENWRLYRANQPKTLRPDMVGHHGETVRGLLRLGFHSGTVPKLYRKLRRAERKRDVASDRKQQEALHHVAEAVRHFTEREFLYLLQLSRSWGGLPIRVGRVRLGCASIQVEFLGHDDQCNSARIGFEERKEFLTICVQGLGWLKNVSPTSGRAFGVAQAGWRAMAAAERDCAASNPAEAEIPWNWWVDAWERDRRGDGLPELPASSTSQSRDSFDAVTDDG
jgi:hypothetical protein